MDAGSGLAFNQHLIRNRVYTSKSYDRFYEFENRDTLRHHLSGLVTLEESLWKFDSTLASVTTFDPETRIYSETGNSILKQPVYTLNVQFGDDYENVNGTESFRLGKLEASTLINGSYYKNPLYNTSKDSVLNERVMYWHAAYAIDYDQRLNYDARPFSGKFSLITNKKRFRLKSDAGSIKMSFANGEKHRAKINQTYSTTHRSASQPHFHLTLHHPVFTREKLAL